MKMSYNLNAAAAHNAHNCGINASYCHIVDWHIEAESVVAFNHDEEMPYDIVVIERAKARLRRLQEDHPELLARPVWGD